MKDRIDDNADLLWVCAGQGAGGVGTFEDPFRGIAGAIERLHAGQTIVLKSGRYTGNVTLQCSGSLQHPISITSEEHGEARFFGAGWFLYDVSDLVVTYLDFIDSPRSAISVIGACERNRFANLRFTGCGLEGETACAVFFGGACGACNIVEECVFERASLPSAGGAAGKGACVGLMVSDGVEDGRARDYIFRRNRFVNHTYGILIGGGDGSPGECGHIVEYNTVDGCSLDGIMITCGDTIVRNNTVRNCRRAGVAVAAGRGSLVEDNRVLDGATGVAATGAAHTVRNNCIVRCSSSAVHMNWNRDPLYKDGSVSSTNILVEANTCIDCGSGPAGTAGVLIEGDASCIVRRNLFHGAGEPFRIRPDGGARRNDRLISDNISSGGCTPGAGSAGRAVEFAGRDRDDFGNDSGFGAQGWMLRSDVCEPAQVDDADARAYAIALEEDAADAARTLIEEVNDEEIARRAMLFSDGAE